MTVPLLKTSEAAFHRHLKKLLARGETISSQVEETVRSILKEVKEKGNKALLAYTQRFDGMRFKQEELRVSQSELDNALSLLPLPEQRALHLAAKRITAFHRHQQQALRLSSGQGSWQYRDSLGVVLGQKTAPLERVGVYVPGGKAAYPSSVLMNIIPAKVAGVKEVIVVSPPSAPQYPPAILAAARIAGGDAFYRGGGAQAIAALAYGTETIPKVDKIVGPGNAYVATAKRLVFGLVDIDMVAGPSEILVIADSSARAEFVAADMLSQAEHDELAAPLCVTTSPKLAQEITHELFRQLQRLRRRKIASASLRNFGAVIIAKSRQEALEVANAIAPEHLELAVDKPQWWLKGIRHTGAIFLGHLSTEPFGDYIAGPNHILPTGGTARFSSALGVYDFLKRTSIIQASPRALNILGPEIIRLAELEGLEAHGLAVKQRLNNQGENHVRRRNRS
jgi:histidinol dehydrogenase